MLCRFYNYLPGIGTHTNTISSPWGECSSHLFSYSQSKIFLWLSSFQSVQCFFQSSLPSKQLSLFDFHDRVHIGYNVSFNPSYIPYICSSVIPIVVPTFIKWFLQTLIPSIQLCISDSWSCAHSLRCFLQSFIPTIPLSLSDSHGYAHIHFNASFNTSHLQYNILYIFHDPSMHNTFAVLWI